MKRFYDHIIHGGDYNPDQWLDRPDILGEDVRLMRLAGMNSASVGIFAWSALEPREGQFEFGWLDDTMDRLHGAGMRVMLATPSAARPAWLSRKYPETLSVGADRVRHLPGNRMRMCYASPVLREKVREIDTRLAERYGAHPGLFMWHISNEYGGDCHCPLCQAAFRDWLRAKYGGDIKALNAQYWSAFWSHTYADFDEIESPAPHGDSSVHALRLDWMRFTSDQTIDFLRAEIAAVKAITPDIPAFTNLMDFFPTIDYFKLAKEIDIVTWDSYPRWHQGGVPDTDTASRAAFAHDLFRSLRGGQPFYLMESTPSLVNWQPYNKLKRPGVHALSSMQAVAHGADSVQYFQWRTGRGGSEKFHGAVVDHAGHENTRVFGEVQALGEALAKLDGVVGARTEAKAALLYDWENRWAIEGLQGLSHDRRYVETCHAHYRALWQRGVAVDVVDETCALDGYALVVAPMPYLLRPGFAARLRDFVAAGGTLVLTYLSGYVGENDLTWLGGFPGDGLMDVAGVWAEEIDTLYPEEGYGVRFPRAVGGLSGAYRCADYTEAIHPADGCEVLAVYEGGMFDGMPAVTRNAYGAGRCYYVAARMCEDFHAAMAGMVAEEAGIVGALGGRAPEGVSVRRRGSHLFIMNFTGQPVRVPLGDAQWYVDVIGGQAVRGQLALDAYGYAVLREES